MTYVSVDEPLGLAYIAAVLEKKGHEVKILDALAMGMKRKEQIRDHIRIGLSNEDIRILNQNFKPDVVGVSSQYTLFAQGAHEVAKIVKEVYPEIPVIFGGAHPSTCPKLVLSDKNVDLVVKGEGEITFLELIETLEKGLSTLKVIGTVSKKGNQIFINPERQRIQDLDSLPFPARHLLPMDSYLWDDYRKVYSMRQPRANMITSRGCPMNCVFCSIHTVWGHGWRATSATKTVDEIEFLVNNYGVQEIAFQDDNLTLDRKRMVNICEEIIRRRIDIKWCTPNGVAIWTLNRELIQKMKRSGCYKLTFGIESGSAETLKFIGKPIDLEKTKKIIKYANDVGIWTHSSFIIGFPYESMSSIKETINYAISSDLDFATFYIATPLPGTRLYKICKQEGLLQDKDLTRWKATTMQATHDTKCLTKEDLQTMKAIAHSKFYNNRIYKFMNPLRPLRKIHSIDDLKFILKLFRTSSEKIKDLTSLGLEPIYE